MWFSLSIWSCVLLRYFLVQIWCPKWMLLRELKKQLTNKWVFACIIVRILQIIRLCVLSFYASVLWLVQERINPEKFIFKKVQIKKNYNLIILRNLSRVFLKHQLWIVNYYVKSSSKNLSNQNKHFCFCNIQCRFKSQPYLAPSSGVSILWRADSWGRRHS